jgi:hypothetical protein
MKHLIYNKPRSKKAENVYIADDICNFYNYIHSWYNVIINVLNKKKINININRFVAK